MCLSGSKAKKTGASAKKKPKKKAGKSTAKCANKAECPLSDKKKKAIVAKLKESGKADDIAKGINDGKIKMYEMNDDVRKKYKEGKDTIALKVGDKIFIDPKTNDALAATHTAHEGTHVLDKTPNKTKADKLRREMKAFNKEADVWEALKKKNPKLKDQQEDLIVKMKKDGTLEDAVKRSYGIP